MMITVLIQDMLEFSNLNQIKSDQFCRFLHVQVEVISGILYIILKNKKYLVCHFSAFCGLTCV